MKERFLINLLTSPWTFIVVFATVRLKVYTILSEGKMDTGEISARCRCMPHLLKPLLDAAVSMGLLRENKGFYRNTSFSGTYLVEGSDSYCGDLIRLQYQEFPHWIRYVEKIQEKSTTGTEFPSDAESHQTFVMAMNNLGLLGETRALVDRVDLRDCHWLVDAGGGSGIYSRRLCEKYPDLKVVLLDTAQTLAVTRRLLPADLLGTRIILREADITHDRFGEDMDAVLLSDVIYDEKIAEPVLRNAWNCLKNGGQLIVRGYYVDPDNSRQLFTALFVLNELVFDSGRKILNMKSLNEMVVNAGFARVQVVPLGQRAHLLTARKYPGLNNAVQ